MDDYYQKFRYDKDDATKFIDKADKKPPKVGDQFVLVVAEVTDDFVTFKLKKK